MEPDDIQPGFTATLIVPKGVDWCFTGTQEVEVECVTKLQYENQRPWYSDWTKEAGIFPEYAVTVLGTKKNDYASFKTSGTVPYEWLSNIKSNIPLCTGCDVPRVDASPDYLCPRCRIAEVMDDVM